STTQPTEAEVLDLAIVIEAMARAFAPQAQLLHSTEGYGWAGELGRVGANHAVLQGIADAAHAANVAAEDIGGQPTDRIIGACDGFFLAAELQHGGHRTKGFFSEDPHLLGDFHQKSGFEEGAAQRMTAA